MTHHFRGGLIASVAAAAVSLSPALAVETTVHPHDLATQAAKRPHVQLSDAQRAAIQNALITVHTDQKVPDKFEPKVGAKLPLTMKLNAMPQALVHEDAAFGSLDYAKTAKELLVVDPMDKTIIAVIPRRYPASGETPSPADWAGTRGRELLGKAPQGEGADHHPLQPVGDSGDTTNGGVQKPKE